MGLCGFFVPIWGELARRPAQTLQHPIVADPVHGESPSDVTEYYVQLAVVFLDHPAAGRLGGAPVPVVRGKGATREISFVIHRPILPRNSVCQTDLADIRLNKPVKEGTASNSSVSSDGYRAREASAPRVTYVGCVERTDS
jgi:hypothetical protein